MFLEHLLFIKKRTNPLLYHSLFVYMSYLTRHEIQTTRYFMWGLVYKQKGRSVTIQTTDQWNLHCSSSTCHHQSPPLRHWSYPSHPPYKYQFCHTFTFQIFGHSYSPHSYKHAMTHGCWKRDMDQELHALTNNCTCGTVSCAEDVTPIGCKWVLFGETQVQQE